jgi:hypothetical protein
MQRDEEARALPLGHLPAGDEREEAVLVPRQDNLDAARAQLFAHQLGDREGGGLFLLPVQHRYGARIMSAMTRIDDDDWIRRGFCGQGREAAERSCHKSKHKSTHDMVPPRPGE